MPNFTSYLPTSVREQVVYFVPTRATESIEYREQYFTSYELDRTRSFLSTTPIRHSVKYTYRDIVASDMRILTRMIGDLTDVRYPLFVPEFALTQPATVTAAGKLQAPLVDIDGRKQPWEFSAKTYFFNRNIALATETTNITYGASHVTADIATNVDAEGYCCPLRLASVSSDIVINSLLYKAIEIEVIFNFQDKRDYSTNRDANNNPQFHPDNLPARFAKVEDAQTTPDVLFVGERVRGRRKVSGAVRRDEDYVSFYQPTFPNEWIIKQVYAAAMSGASPVVVMPTEQAGNYISAYFFEPCLLYTSPSPRD